MLTSDRARAFCDRFGLRIPILLAPMAGASDPRLSAAIMAAGGMGACGALLMTPQQIGEWGATVRSQASGPFQLNLWVPDPAPHRDAAAEAQVRTFLAQWGPEVPPEAGDAVPPDFDSQCDALIAASPAAVSSVMGLFPAPFVARLKDRAIPWFAVVSTVAEAVAAEAAGADAAIVQGFEAGGHRARFEADHAERDAVGLFALLPAVVDAVTVPVIATGGIGDARGIAAALMLGASAAQIGTGFLRCPEAGIHPAWADLIAQTAPEATRLSRVFSGRAGRSAATAYVAAATGPEAPLPAPYPVQRGLTAAMRAEGLKMGDPDRLQAWAGQASLLARAEPATPLARELWAGANALLGWDWAA